MGEFNPDEYSWLLPLYQRLRAVEGITAGQMMAGLNTSVYPSACQPIMSREQLEAVIEVLEELDE